VNRSRSARPAAEPRTEAGHSCGILRMLARDERAYRKAWQAKRNERSPVRRPKRALVTAIRKVIGGGNFVKTLIFPNKTCTIKSL